MTYKVSANDLPIRLGETDTIKSALQNVAIILRSRQGTCPMYRDFGLPQKYIGLPISAARPLLYAEIREAVEAYEPRAKVLNVTFPEQEDFTEGLIPVVEVEIRNES